MPAEKKVKSLLSGQIGFDAQDLNAEPALLSNELPGMVGLLDSLSLPLRLSARTRDVVALGGARLKAPAPLPATRLCVCPQVGLGAFTHQVTFAGEPASTTAMTTGHAMLSTGAHQLGAKHLTYLCVQRTGQPGSKNKLTFIILDRSPASANSNTMLSSLSSMNDA